MWPVEGNAVDWPKLSHLRPESVLDEFDGPRLFTLRTDQGELLLAYFSGEDHDKERFLLVPAGDTLINAINDNRISLRDALTVQGLAWTIDRMRDGSLSEVRQIRQSDLPASALPVPNVFLHPLAAPFFRVRLMGSRLQGARVPASVVNRAVAGATGAMRVLTQHALRKKGIGRPAESVRKLYDLPAIAFAFRSFEVSFGHPELGQLDFETSATMEHVTQMLKRGIIWAVGNASLDELESDERSSIIQAIAKIVPPSSGPVEKMELSGQVTGETHPVSFSRETSSRVVAALHSLTFEARRKAYEGYIRELDKDRLTFWLRDEFGANIKHVAFDENQLEEIMLYFEHDRPIQVLALETPGRAPTEETPLLTYMPLNPDKED